MTFITLKYILRHETDTPPSKLGPWRLNPDIVDRKTWKYVTEVELDTFLQYAQAVDLIGSIYTWKYSRLINIHEFLPQRDSLLEEAAINQDTLNVRIGITGQFGLRDFQPYVRNHIMVIAGSEIDPDLFQPILGSYDNKRRGEEPKRNYATGREIAARVRQLLDDQH